MREIDVEQLDTVLRDGGVLIDVLGGTTAWIRSGRSVESGLS